jgi:hypothetical protein
MARAGAMGAIVLTATVLAVGANSCGDSADAPATPADVLARGGSIAQVTIDAHAYDFEVTCYDAGAGSVIAVGTGVEVDSSTGAERSTRIFVQAFLGDSYVGLTISAPEDPADGEAAADDEVYEASLEDSFDLLLEDDVIRADNVQFVRNIDLTAGSGEPVGEGSLYVECGTYEQGVPPGLER